MSLILGIKRSYRYFIPRLFFEPRRLVRESFIPIFFTFVGWSIGAYAYGGNFDRVSKIAMMGFGILLFLKWWSGVGINVRPNLSQRFVDP
jgi:hypothetical protein